MALRNGRGFGLWPSKPGVALLGLPIKGPLGSKDKAKRGCPPPTSSALFDCNAGFSNWDIAPGRRFMAELLVVEDWSQARKDWCCRTAPDGGKRMARTHRRACTQFDCHLGVSHWQLKWPPEKKEYCCKRILTKTKDERAVARLRQRHGMPRDHHGTRTVETPCCRRHSKRLGHVRRSATGLWRPRDHFS